MQDEHNERPKRGQYKQAEENNLHGFLKSCGMVHQMKHGDWFFVRLISFADSHEKMSNTFTKTILPYKS